MSTAFQSAAPAPSVAVTERAIDAVFLTSNACEQALECIAHLREPEIASIVVVDNALPTVRPMPFAARIPTSRSSRSTSPPASPPR
jgi:hypothetical protein